MDEVEVQRLKSRTLLTFWFLDIRLRLSGSSVDFRGKHQLAVPPRRESTVQYSQQGVAFANPQVPSDEMSSHGG
jgi:hypothetical protein